MEKPPTVSAPPPLPGSKKPFAVQAGQASVFAPILCIGANIIINLGGMQLSPMAKIITGSLSTLLILLGFVFGIIALLGMRRNGSRGIIGWAITGTLINGILIFFMIIGFFAVKAAAERQRELQQQQMEQQQRQ